MPKRVAVVMAGGFGERFWPVSTPRRPKQFLRLSDPEKSLLELSCERAIALCGAEASFIQTGELLADASKRECPALPRGNVLAEPAKRNTAGAVVWAAANLMARNPEEWTQVTMALLTADHVIEPLEGFVATARAAMNTAERTDGLVTIGIPPTRPETGYGYIEVGEVSVEAREVKQFKEKPDQSTAKQYLAQGDYLWNSGMFFWTLDGLIKQMQAHAPALADAATSIGAAILAGDDKKARALFESLEGESIDIALLEKSDKAFVVEARFQWDDLGAWDSVARARETDPAGNVVQGAARLFDVQECVVFNESGRTTICALGVEDLVIVATDDTVLILPKERAQEVKRFGSHQNSKD